MKKVLLGILMLVALLCLLAGCRQTASPAGTEPKQKEIPSDAQLESYDYSKLYFPEVSKAVWLHDGTSEQIAPEDSRLTKLIQLLLYSENEQSTATIQGLIPYEEATAAYDCPESMLEITFVELSTERIFMTGLYKLLVCADRYYLFGRDVNIPDYIELHYPYAEVLHTDVVNQVITDEEFDRALYGDGEAWIDLPLLAGFGAE